jgi:DNA-directed RNA polymerase beta subunit
MPKIREFGDIDYLRSAIYRSVKQGFANKFPVEGKFVSLNIKDVEIPEDKHYTKHDEKKAKLFDRDLTVPVKGKMELVDKATGKVIDKRKLTLGHLPYLTRKFGTFIGNGTDFSVGNQMRLLPGAYTREKANGEIETQFNVEGKTGFRISMDPKSAKFKLNIRNNRLPLYPILKNVGVSDKAMEEAWGKEIMEGNRIEREDAVDTLYDKLAGYNKKEGLSRPEKSAEILRHMQDLKMSKEVNKLALGEPYDKVTPDVLLKSTGKILKVFRREEPPVERDSLLFKSFHSVEDFIRERIEKDAGRLSKKLVRKMDKVKDLSKVPPGYFSKHFKSIVRGDSRAFPLEEINPIQNYDNLHRNIVTGEGGIGSLDMVTMEARNVHPSQFAFIDAFRGPESATIGIDTRLALNTYKGDDKRLYSKFVNAKTGKVEYLNPVQVYDKKVAFPGEMKKARPRTMHKWKIKPTRKKDVDYYVDSGNEMFSVYSNMVPMYSAVQGNRLFMAGKAASDTLPLLGREAPIVRSEKADGEDFETFYGRKVLSEVSPVDGEVKSVSGDYIKIKGKDGKVHNIDLFNDYPLSRKTGITNIPVVKPGQKVKKGDMLAGSNFTDDEGTMAVGTHLKTSFLPLKGLTFEDGIVISDSASKKLTSEQVYKYELPLEEGVVVGKKNYSGYFPTIYNKDQFDKVALEGVPKKGTKVYKGDPLIAAIKEKSLSPTDLTLGRLHKVLRNKYDDAAVNWDHGTEGEIVDAVVTKDKVKVYVKTKTPAKVGDKLSGRYGNKGVISAILQDHEMPLIKRTGERLDMALNPVGVISRINPAQVAEGLLGKIGKEKGLIYRMPGITHEKYNEIAKKELKKHNIPDSETLVDPQEGELKGMVTYPYFYKLSKLAEAQLGSREMSSYTSNMQPVKGNIQGIAAGMTYSSTMRPIQGAKPEGKAVKVGADLSAALIGHGARHNLRDVSVIKGQKNDEYWRAVRLGYPPPSPDVPFVYKKFEAMLKGAGSNVTKTGDMINIMPMTDDDIDKLSNGEIKNPKFLNARSLEPEKGGLFDFGVTGGPAGEKWSHISLAEPMPNPMMEGSIKNILGLNQKSFEAVIAGKEELDGMTGGKAIKAALSKINVMDEIDKLKRDIPLAKKSHKDKLVKKLKSLIGIKNSGKKPAQMVLDKFPIIPPIYRPISALGEKGTVAVSDANNLYRDLFHANTVMKDLSDLDDDDLGDEKKNLYDAIKATAGLGDPISMDNKTGDVKGFIKKIVGKQPKTGFFFDKLVSKTQDLVGRGVVVPDSTLAMDELGVPEKIAWKQFRPFVMKELVSRRGIPAVRADEMIEERHQLASDALDKVMSERPILMNRAPTLHRFGIMAFKGKRTPNDAIGTSPPITGPFGMDYDGDAAQLFVPVSEEAVIEAKEKMMPSKNLFSIKDYGVHYTPPHENILGLFVASSERGKNKPVKFNTVEDVQRAIETGKITYDTVVEVANA